MTQGPKQDSQRVHVGQKAPFFRAQSLTGEIVSNEDLKGGWVMLSFHRFASCPVCNLALQKYKQRYDDFRDAELRLVAVFHSARERLLEYMESDELPFTVLADPSIDIYEKFGAGTRLRSLFDPRTLFSGLRSLGKGSFNPLEMDGPPHVLPSDFIIDENGVVRHIHHGAYVGDSLTVDRALEFLAGFRQGRA